MHLVIFLFGYLLSAALYSEAVEVKPPDAIAVTYTVDMGPGSTGVGENDLRIVLSGNVVVNAAGKERFVTLAYEHFRWMPIDRDHKNSESPSTLIDHLNIKGKDCILSVGVSDGMIRCKDSTIFLNVTYNRIAIDKLDLRMTINRVRST